MVIYLVHIHPGVISSKHAAPATFAPMKINVAILFSILLRFSRDCWDNAVMESFFATLKKELIHRQKYETRASARHSIFEYIEVFYNGERHHSSLGYQSPEMFEQAV